MIIKFGDLGINRVKPPHELLRTQDGHVQFRELINYIARDKKIKKIGGTENYNSSTLSDRITWATRSYHKRADGSFRKVALCFSGGSFYYGDDVAGTLTKIQVGFTSTAFPLSATMQVSGNTIRYFYIGKKSTDEVYKYDGNGSFTFEKTSLNSDFGRIIKGGIVHLDRMWYWFVNSSILSYSTTLKPEDLTTDSGDITIGQETDSFIQAVVIGPGETLYIFKNQSIWQLYGRTVSTFEFRKVTDKYGLATKRSIYPVGGGFVFLNEFDKELYFFGGTESSIRPITETSIRLRDILDKEHIDECCMTVHDGLFRFSFYHVDDNIYQDRELIYPLSEPGIDGEPKWSMSKGAKILCYSVWNQQGDEDELVTGRADTGKLMYHNRTNNFDGSAIETKFRTGDIIASEDKIVRFKGFFVKGRPGPRDRKITFRYYVDARTGQAGEDNLDMSGETKTIGSLTISLQELFNNRLIPYHGKSIGNSISFEVYDNNQNTFLEFYSIMFSAIERYKIRNKLVGV